MTVIIVLLIIAVVVVLGLVWFTARTARQVEAAVPPRGKFMEIDGQRVHYVDTGAGSASGPAIVMIHGLGGNLMNFTYALVDRLAGEFRVIALDRPGSGYSVRPDDTPAVLSVQAATVAKLIRALDLKQPLVVGHSLGGAVSLALALNHPDCVGGLALLAPLTHAQEDVPDAFKGLIVPSPALRRLIAWTLATPAAILQGEKLLKLVFAPDSVPQDFRTRGGGLLSLRPQSFYGSSSDIVAINDELPAMMTRYASLTLPFGMLFGYGDNILKPSENGEGMKAKVPTLDLVLTDGGHMLPVSHPDQAAELIRRTAKRVSGPVTV